MTNILKSRKKGRRDRPYKPFKFNNKILLVEKPKKANKPKPVMGQAAQIEAQMNRYPKGSGPHNKKKRRKIRKAVDKATRDQEEYEAELRAQEMEEAQQENSEAREVDERIAGVPVGFTVRQNREAREAEVSNSRKRTADDADLDDESDNSYKGVKLGGAEKPTPKKPKASPPVGKKVETLNDTLQSELPNTKPSPLLSVLPFEMLKEVYASLDPTSRTSLALTSKQFYAFAYSMNEACPAKFPDIKCRYGSDIQRQRFLASVGSLFNQEEFRCCYICRKYKPINNVETLYYKNCPKKRDMPDDPISIRARDDYMAAHPNARATEIPKVVKMKPTPEKFVWQDEDWSVVSVGACKSRERKIQILHVCPRCTLSVHSIHLGWPPETEEGRWLEEGHPLGNGASDYVEEGGKRGGMYVPLSQGPVHVPAAPAPVVPAVAIVEGKTDEVAVDVDDDLDAIIAKKEQELEELMDMRRRKNGIKEV